MRMTAELADARQELAQQAAAAEKRRIARDVHDLVGHGLAAMMLHIVVLVATDRSQRDGGLLANTPAVIPARTVNTAAAKGATRAC
jgi:hypothetical protein